MDAYRDADLVLVRPLVVREKTVHHFFHRKVRNQLVLREFDARNGIEMADTLQVLFDVFAFVGDAGRRYDGIDENFKTYFAAQIVGHIAFLSKIERKAIKRF